MKTTSMIIRTQPLPKLALIGSSRRRILRGAMPIPLPRKKAHARRVP
jgi:hypothetical protein